MVRPAPIVLFAFNRPVHVQQTLESLAANSLAAASDLFIFIDGPKLNFTEEQQAQLDKVKDVVRQKQWCKNVVITHAEKNKGLASSIIDGVTEVVNQYGKVIVIEDDVLVSPHFLQFMNDALNCYEADPKVLSIGSWNYFCSPEKLPGNFFFPFPDSIAWATFDRAWKLFEKDGATALSKIKEQGLLKKFNGELGRPYFSDMLQLQIDGKISSWAIRWTATAIINDAFSFFPQQTLSKHMGFGIGATHETGEKDYNSHLVLAEQPIAVEKIPVEPNELALDAWRKFVKSNFYPTVSYGVRLKQLLKKVLKKMGLYSKK